MAICIKEFWQRWRKDFWRLFRFGITGTICSLIHYGIYCLFLLFTNTTIAYTAGYGVGLLCNYGLTTYFTFKGKPSKNNYCCPIKPLYTAISSLNPAEIGMISSYFKFQAPLE